MKIYLPLIILLLGFITFFTHEIEIVSDMGFYMNSALNLYLGQGYTDTNGSLILKRAPLFPLLILFSYWLIGISPWSAFWVVRIFAILNPVIIYILAKKFYGKWVGFSAGLLVLSSYSINYWSHRHIDNVWPFFILLSLLTIYLAFEKKSYFYFILSGFLVGISFLIKQSSMLFAPLPFFLWLLIGEYRKKKNLIGSVVYIFVIILLIFPWIYYVYSHTSNIKYACLGGLGEIAAVTTLSPNIFLTLKKYFLGLLAYYRNGINSLSVNFLLAPLFVLSWFFTIVKALYRDKRSILLGMCLLLLSPYISYVGQNNLRIGQLLFFIFLSYMVTAWFLLESFNIFVKVSKKRFRVRENIYKYGRVCLIFLLILFQSFISYQKDKGNRNFLKKSFFIAKILGRKVTWEVHGIYGESFNIQKVVDWISENLPPEQRLMTDWYSYSRALYFKTRGKYSLHFMPIKGELGRIQKYENWEGEKGNIIFLTSLLPRCDPRNRFIYLAESELLNAIQSHDINNLIITQRWVPLSDYFLNHPDFKKLVGFDNNQVEIYQVKKIRPLENFETIITEKASIYLRRLKAEDLKKFEHLKKKLFKDILGWEEDKINQVINFESRN